MGGCFDTRKSDVGVEGIKGIFMASAGGMGPPIVMMMFSAAALMFILTPVNT